MNSIKDRSGGLKLGRMYALCHEALVAIGCSLTNFMQATAHPLGEIHFFRTARAENMVRVGVNRFKRRVCVQYVPKQDHCDMSQRNHSIWGGTAYGPGFAAIDAPGWSHFVAAVSILGGLLITPF